MTGTPCTHCRSPARGNPCWHKGGLPPCHDELLVKARAEIMMDEMERRGHLRASYARLYNGALRDVEMARDERNFWREASLTQALIAIIVALYAYSDTLGAFFK